MNAETGTPVARPGDAETVPRTHHDSAAHARSTPLALASATLFFVSGASALVYQVTWQRVLALHSGVGIYSIAMIVSAFMAGLGLGSLWGGTWSARVSPRQALSLFARMELAVAAFGAASCWLYYDMLYVRAAELYNAPWRTALLHFAALALPTTLMGMSLPFLVRAVVRDARAAAGHIGWLYGMNMLGAAVGAWLGPWVLMRLAGLRGAVLVAAAGNLLVGLGALRLTTASTDAIERGATPRAEPAVPAESHHPFVLWLGLYALSGFCALALEIVWFRLVDVAVKSSAFTFGSVLALYLAGSAVGALVGLRWAPRLRHPLRAFLTCQAGLLILSGLAVWLLTSVPAHWLSPLSDYWGRYDGITFGRGGDARLLATLYLGLPLALFGLPTFLMGLSFPILQRAVQDDPETSSRKVGLLQAANIAGCTLGSIAIGLLALGHFGTTGSLRALLGLGFVFCAVGLAETGARGRFAALALTLAGLVWVLPGPERLWPRLHGSDPRQTLVAEDASGLAVLHPEPSGGWRISVNGKGNGLLPFVGLHVQLGAVPALIHAAPRRIALIGLGSGSTAWAAALRPETQRVDVFEIVAPEGLLLPRLLERAPLPQLGQLWADPRVRLLEADGRHALERGQARYDVIEADALRPHSAYAGNLYSLEFFRSCLRRLNPGGLVCTWAPTNRVYATFSQALPYVLALDEGRLLVGSDRPLKVDLAVWRARLDSPPVAGYLGRELAADVWRALATADLGRPKARQRPDVNLDLYPRDELLVP